MSEEKTTYVYGLYCPVKEAFFYVGKSVNPIPRFRGHMTDAKAMGMHRTFPHLYSAPGGNGEGTAKSDWMVWLAGQDLEPELVVLEVVRGVEPTTWRAADALGRDRERHWIHRLANEGHPLTNVAMMPTGNPTAEERLEQAIERGRELFGP